jgi:stage II sporulation protein AA (anti-sigma F factor antagonist)
MIKAGYRFETQKRDRLLVVRLLGEIDHHGAVGLREELDRLLLIERPSRLLMDLSRVDFMDSAGLGLLMGRLRLVREMGGVMAVRCSGRVLKILQLSGMERFMEIETDERREVER